MLAVNNLTSAPEHTRSMAALPLGESPLLKVLLTHIKGRCFQSWLIVPPVEMPVPSHVPHSLPFRTPRSKGASGGSLSLSLGLSLPMWREGTPGENTPQRLRRLMDRIQVYLPPRQDNSWDTAYTSSLRSQQDWGSVTRSETCSPRLSMLTAFLSLPFLTSLQTMPEITPK